MKAMTTAVLLMCVLATGVAGPVLAGEKAPGASAADRRLQQLEDREAIRELLVVYGRLLDKKDLAGYSKLFAKDGVWEGGIGSATGPDGIYKMLETVYARVTPGQYGNDYHIMSDFIVSVDGDTATSWSRWTWVIEGGKGTPEISRSGHYEDTLVREGGEWKFKHRLTVTEMPTPEKDGEAQIFRKDHRDKD